GAIEPSIVWDLLALRQDLPEMGKEVQEVR
ncbi:hypothetical protein Tco_0607302, partial [Tanacetum coccineum]